MMQTHVIKALSLNIQTPHEGMARRVQSNWIRGMEEVVLETLEETCDQLISADEVLFVEQLNVDLGQFSGQNLDLSEFKSRFRQQLETQLHLVRQNKLWRTNTPKLYPGLSHLKNEILSTPSVLRQILIYYLQTGHLPWWEAALEADLIQAAKTWFTTAPGHFLEFVGDCASTRPLAFFRLMDLIETDFIKDLLSQLEIETCLPVLIEQLQWDKIHLVVQSRPSQAQKTIWAFALFQQKSIKTQTALSSIPPAVLMQQYLATFGLSELLSNSISGVPLSGLEDAVLDPLLKLDAKIVSNQPSGDHLMVSHAGGVVLLASFLHRAFSALGWVENGNFIDESSRLRAIHWLKYLNSGQAELPEHQYTLEKVICGLNPTEYLEPLLSSFSQAELDEVAEVLASLRHYWPAVYNTSEHNLRTSFLERLGILYLNEEGNWTLQVEAGSFDVLLHLLPPQISLSMIVLPWLNHFIYVEWSQR